MVTIARMMVEAEITKLMKPYSEKPPTERTLELSTPMEMYSGKVSFGRIVGLTVPPLSDKPILKVGLYNSYKEKGHIENYTLFSLGNFDEHTLEMVLNNARESKKNSKTNTTSNEQEQNHQVPMEEIPTGTKKLNHQHE